MKLSTELLLLAGVRWRNVHNNEVQDSTIMKRHDEHDMHDSTLTIVAWASSNQPAIVFRCSLPSLTMERVCKKMQVMRVPIKWCETTLIDASLTILSPAVKPARPTTDHLLPTTYYLLPTTYYPTKAFTAWWPR